MGGTVKVYTKDHVKELMLAHYPVLQDTQYCRWYCACGVYIDYLEKYGNHLDTILHRTKGD
jgi:hypothetical protein